jgi:hypothetical protein
MEGQMKIIQLSIFLSNEHGRLLDVMSTLTTAKINIRALSMAETTDFGVLRMIVDDNERALRALRANEIVVKITDVLAVQVNDEPGGLGNVLKILTENNINIEYMYAFVEKKDANAIMVFRLDDQDRGIKALLNQGVKLLTAEDIGNL